MQTREINFKQWILVFSPTMPSVLPRPGTLLTRLDPRPHVESTLLWVPDIYRSSYFALAYCLRAPQLCASSIKPISRLDCPNIFSFCGSLDIGCIEKNRLRLWPCRKDVVCCKWIFLLIKMKKLSF